MESLVSIASELSSSMKGTTSYVVGAAIVFSGLAYLLGTTHDAVHLRQMSASYAAENRRLGAPGTISLALVNAVSKQKIMDLSNGQEINLFTVTRSNPSFNIEAIVSGNAQRVGSVVFEYSNGMSTMRSISTMFPPFTLCRGGLFQRRRQACLARLKNFGNHTVRATPHRYAWGLGASGVAVSLSFTVVAVDTLPTNRTTSNTTKPTDTGPKPNNNGTRTTNITTVPKPSPTNPTNAPPTKPLTNTTVPTVNVTKPNNSTRQCKLPKVSVRVPVVQARCTHSHSFPLFLLLLIV
jgi:hypothetical protein